MPPQSECDVVHITSNVGGIIRVMGLGTTLSSYQIGTLTNKYRRHANNSFRTVCMKQAYEVYMYV